MAIIGWLVRQSHRAGASTVRLVKTSTARNRGQALPVNQTALAETRRTLAADDNVAAEAPVVQCTLTSLDATLSGTTG